MPAAAAGAAFCHPKGLDRHHSLVLNSPIPWKLATGAEALELTMRIHKPMEEVLQSLDLRHLEEDLGPMARVGRGMRAPPGRAAAVTAKDPPMELMEQVGRVLKVETDIGWERHPQVTEAVEEVREVRGLMALQQSPAMVEMVLYLISMVQRAIMALEEAVEMVPAPPVQEGAVAAARSPDRALVRAVPSRQAGTASLGPAGAVVLQPRRAVVAVPADPAS